MLIQYAEYMAEIFLFPYFLGQPTLNLFFTFLNIFPPLILLRLMKSEVNKEKIVGSIFNKTGKRVHKKLNPLS